MAIVHYAGFPLGNSCVFVNFGFVAECFVPSYATAHTHKPLLLIKKSNHSINQPTHSNIVNEDAEIETKKDTKQSLFKSKTEQD